MLNIPRYIALHENDKRDSPSVSMILSGLFEEVLCCYQKTESQPKVTESDGCVRHEIKYYYYGYGTRFLWYCQYDCTKNGKVEKRNEPDREQCAVIPADRNTEMKDIKTGECKSGHCHVFPWPYKGHSQKEGVNYPRQVETLLPAPCVDEYGNFQVASSCESQFPDQLRAIGLVEQGEQHRTTSSDTDQGEQQGLEDVAHSVRAHSCRYWELETVSFRRFHSHDALCEKSNFMFSCQSCGATFQSQLQWLQAIGNFVIPTCCTSGNRSKERVLHTDC
ncbi:uncharacterized protein LOC135374647 isoform X2 [Ornithodoros turicata]|uniref:uncharacterized protein LOC135374647 isoform X2 n=1 Tax=Ornithodoros turicata TaxID=34597 RepID=UPI003138F242